LVEAGLQLRGDLVAALAHLADGHAHLHGLLELLGILGVARGERVDLLEDARDRREVGRLDLHQVGDDLRRVLLPVGQLGAKVEAGELDQQRERVRQRQEQVDGLALAEGRALLAHHVAHRAVVRVREDHALGRAGGAGRVDEDARVIGGDGGGALVELGLVAPAAALAQIGERRRLVARLAVEHDHVLEVRKPVADLADLGELLLVLHEHRA
jgi:hypothetical protein